MKTIVTHDSSFHTDDVFAVATLLLKLGDAKVIRSREMSVIESGDYVVDAGFIYDPSKNRFDHHQTEGAGKRENDIPYASFGLVWKEFGEELSGGPREAGMIDKRLAQPIDAHDNGFVIADYHIKGVREYSITDFLLSYLQYPEGQKMDINEVFMKLVSIAKDLLEREIRNAKTITTGEDKVKEIYNNTVDKKIIILPEPLSWMKVLTDTEDALFVIYPRNDGKWSSRGIPQNFESYLPRKPFPSAWGGLEEKALQEISGVQDAFFCHKGLWLSVAKSKEGAIALAKKALEN
jgi:uncharacterized UPF0160 family protein